MSKNKPIVCGDKFLISDGGEVVVVRYNNAKDILIEHCDENKHRAHVYANQLRKGQIKNPFKPTVAGVGYFGHGPMKATEGNKNTFEYTVWSNMLKRVYCNEKSVKNACYQGCSVVEEWHNFQNFAGWSKQQPNNCTKGFELDKDLLVLGNRTYGPDKCSYVPHRINSILCDREGDRGDLPVGVTHHKNKYRSRLNVDGKRVHLGLYETCSEAFNVYREEKIKYVREVVNEYKQYLHPQVYNNLLNWTVDIIEIKENYDEISK